MNLSYWEHKEWLQNIDFTIIGSGIVGLSTAVFLKKRFPKAKILILEKGILPQGASTKNAGFACFGSLSELLEDLKSHSEDEVLSLLKNRVEGLQMLRQMLGDEALDYTSYGGYELFLKKDNELFTTCVEKMKDINAMLSPVFKSDVFSVVSNTFHFEGIQSQYLFNQFEAQIDTGKMMHALIQKTQKLGITILNSITVDSFVEKTNAVQVKTNHFEYNSSKLIITTNGFTSQLISQNIKPARAQVLITKPIQDLHIKGTFHLDCGYYYFRNIDNRILFGGGRNLDFDGETTTTMITTPKIQDKLEHLLRTVILPNQNVEIDRRWTGIMGVGPQKTPIIKQHSNRVVLGVRMGGMGVALGAAVGKKIADIIT
ncbi:FAD-binding oxidoreductase [Flavobacteriaceae bacterium]|nr:FAD-binding oxidoreductase [Flavobacteriaceae bacterium]